MSALNSALVSVAKSLNLAGKVFEDGKVDFKDAGTIIGGLGDLSGLASIDFAGVISEAGKLSDAAKASAVAAFKGAFDLKNDVQEGAVELAVDACFDALLAGVKGKAAVAALLPKAA